MANGCLEKSVHGQINSVQLPETVEKRRCDFHDGKFTTRPTLTLIGQYSVSSLVGFVTVGHEEWIG